MCGYYGGVGERTVVTGFWSYGEVEMGREGEEKGKEGGWVGDGTGDGEGRDGWWMGG